MEAPRDHVLGLLEPTPARAAAITAASLLLFASAIALTTDAAGTDFFGFAVLPALAVALCYSVRTAIVLYLLLVPTTGTLLSYSLIDDWHGLLSPELPVRIIMGAVLVLVIGGVRHGAIQLRRTNVSTQYLDDILRSLADMLLVVDGQGIVLKANLASSKAFGPSEDELVGRSVFS